MMTEKPVFRFVGVPQGGVKQQFEAAKAALILFRCIQEEDLGSTAEIEDLFYMNLGAIKEVLNEAKIKIFSPRWFSELLEKDYPDNSEPSRMPAVTDKK